mmetsp:Transcript_92990/g.265467  ORF Transcript_92990/g.265467 Transcript_92990/m.265467 type:complete len:92 (-) Transcript_92990:213-488(-)
MGYGGSSNFPSNNDYVLGIFVPTSCVGQCGGGGDDDDDYTPPSDDDDSTGNSDCYNCVLYGGGVACGDKCSDVCYNCVVYGGGTACAPKCA